MIWESWPWKRDIAKRVEAIQRRTQQRRWSDASYARVEQDVFLAAYAVRKRLEAGKISDEVESMRVRATEHRRLGRPVDVLNWHKIDELYDLAVHKKVSVDLRMFCNQIIHSFVFVLVHAERGGLDGFFLASDREKDRRLLFFGIAQVIKIFMSVANDQIVSMKYSRSGVRKSAKITRKSNRREAGQ